MITNIPSTPNHHRLTQMSGNETVPLSHNKCHTFTESVILCEPVPYVSHSKCYIFTESVIGSEAVPHVIVTVNVTLSQNL